VELTTDRDVNSTVVPAVGADRVKFAAITVLDRIGSLNVTVKVDPALLEAVVDPAVGAELENVGAVVSAVVPYTDENQAEPIAAV
jgi:hypothetical protein